MKWNNHYRDIPEGAHAFLGASKYHWLNYDEEKLISSYKNAMAAQYGTRLHAFARECIELGQRLPKSKKTLNSFVNDAIGFKMSPEQPLFYSANCFGTADAIDFRDSNKFLRIHDLKTGTTPASMKQLYIYSALFCLEYDWKPEDIGIELRIYQNDDVITERPEAEQIREVIDKIIFADKVIDQIKMGEIY